MESAEIKARKLILRLQPVCQYLALKTKRKMQKAYNIVRLNKLKYTTHVDPEK